MRLDKQFSLLYGTMLGDGCLSKTRRNYSIAITLNLKDDILFMEDIVHPILKDLTGRQISIKLRKQKNVIYVSFSDKRLFTYLNKIGFPIGKKGQKLIVPQIFYTKGLLKYICQGLFATDGSFFLTDNNRTLYPRVEICSISQPLMRQLYTYLNNRSIKCHFYLAKRNKKSPWSKKQQYRLQINGK